MSARSTRALALPFACALAVAPIAAQGSFKSALPEDTVLLVTAPNIAASLEEMRGMPLFKIWAEQEVQDFFADSLQMAGAYWEMGLEQGRAMHAQGKLPFSPDDLMKLRLDSASFAITKLRIAPGQREPKAEFGILLHAEFGDSAKIWRRVVETLIDRIVDEAGDEIERSTNVVGGATVHTLAPPAELGQPMALHVAFVGDSMLIGTLGDDVRTTLESMASGKARLTASKTYGGIAKRLDTKGVEAEVYLRPGGVFDFLISALETAKELDGDFPVDPAGIDRVIDAIGLRGIRAIGGTSKFDGDRSVSKTFIDAPAPLRKGLFAGSDKELDLGFLRWVPTDAVSFSASTVNLMGIWDALETGLAAYDPELAKMLLGHLRAQEEQLGVSLRDDLFGAFGGEFISWSMPVSGFGTTPELALLVGVKDQERLMKAINTVAALTGGAVEIDEARRRGITVYQVRLDIDFGGGGGLGGMNPLDMIVPTFGFKDGYMVLGLSPSDVSRVFRRMEREDDPKGDIRTNPEFAAYLDRVPKQGLSSVSFTDWKAQFEGYYQLVTSVLALFPLDDEIPFDFSLLPDSSTLTQHLGGAVSWSQSTAEGHVTTGISPFGPEAAALFVGCVGAGVATWLALAR